MAAPYPVIPGGPTADTAATIWFGSAHNGAGWWTFQATPSGQAVITAANNGTFTLYSAYYDFDQQKWARNEWALLTEVTTWTGYLLDRPYWLYATNGFAAGPYEEYDGDWIQLRDDGVRRTYAVVGRFEKGRRFTYQNEYNTYTKLTDSGFRSELNAANTVPGATGQPIQTQGFDEDQRVGAHLAGGYGGPGDDAPNEPGTQYSYSFYAQHQVVGFTLNLTWNMSSLAPWDPNRPVNAVADSEEWESDAATYAGQASISAPDGIRYRIGDSFDTMRNRLPCTFELRSGAPLAALEADYDPDTGGLIHSWTAPADANDPSFFSFNQSYDLPGNLSWDVSHLVNGNEFTVKAVINPSPSLTHPNPHYTEQFPDNARNAHIFGSRMVMRHAIYPPRVRFKLYRPVMLPPPPPPSVIVGGPIESRRAFRRSDI